MARQNEDSMLVIRNLPRSLAIGQAIQPSFKGQPPNPVWTIRAFPMARQAVATACGSATNAATRPRGAGRGTSLSRSNGGPLSGSGRVPGPGGPWTTGQARAMSSMYSRCSARSLTHSGSVWGHPWGSIVMGTQTNSR